MPPKSSKKLKELIDQYGEADIKENLAKKAKDLIKEEINPLVKEPGTYEGTECSLTVSESATQVLDVESIAKKLKREDFLSCVNISMEKLKQVMAPAEIMKHVTGTKISRKFKVKKK